MEFSTSIAKRAHETSQQQVAAASTVRRNCAHGHVVRLRAGSACRDGGRMGGLDIADFSSYRTQIVMPDGHYYWVKFETTGDKNATANTVFCQDRLHRHHVKSARPNSSIAQPTLDPPSRASPSWHATGVMLPQISTKHLFRRSSSSLIERAASFRSVPQQQFRLEPQ